MDHNVNMDGLSNDVKSHIKNLHDEIVGEIVLEFARCKDMDEIQKKCIWFGIDPRELKQ